jgi:hypothetical protein
MNSLPDNEMDKKRDQLLTESVGPSAVPAGFSIAGMPPRPKFNWALAGGLVACIALAVALMFTWVAWQPSVENKDAVAPGRELWILLSDNITAGAENLSSTTFLMYAAVAMGAVYAFSANRIIRLYKYH